MTAVPLIVPSTHEPGRVNGPVEILIGVATRLAEAERSLHSSKESDQ